MLVTALGGAAAFAGGCGAARSGAPRSAAAPRTSAPPAPLTVAAWRRARGMHYYIAHRGSGDVFPEHTMVAYQGAVDAGAQCLEVSVDRTSDDVLVCMHDLTYDRTTTGHGAVAAQPSSVLDRIGVRQPQLGPYWLRPPLPAVPLLRDVLERFGHRCVICLEAKDDTAYPPMMALVEELGLQQSVIVKAYRTSRRIAQAQAAGYPVFAYLGPQDMTTRQIGEVARTLHPDRDCLVLPATTGDDLTYFPDALITEAVAHGVPVWVYPVHRRADAAHYFALGVAGAVTSSYAYVSSDSAAATHDCWEGKRIAPGEMTRQPESAAIAPLWTGTEELTLATPGTQQFLTLGQLSPLRAARDSYRVTFAACWQVLPVDPTSNVTLAFGHADDTYYEHRRGRSDGYHAIMRPDGRLELYRHEAGRKDGVLLAGTGTPAAAAGEWLSFQLDVTPAHIRWSRTDTDPPAAVTARDSSYRGGYLHVGRTAYDDQVQLALRGLVVES